MATGKKLGVKSWEVKIIELWSFNRYGLLTTPWAHPWKKINATIIWLISWNRTKFYTLHIRIVDHYFFFSSAGTFPLRTFVQVGSATCRLSRSRLDASCRSGSTTTMPTLILISKKKNVSLAARASPFSRYAKIMLSVSEFRNLSPVRDGPFVRIQLLWYMYMYQ